MPGQYYQIYVTNFLATEEMVSLKTDAVIYGEITMLKFITLSSESMKNKAPIDNVKIQKF